MAHSKAAVDLSKVLIPDLSIDLSSQFRHSDCRYHRSERDRLESSFNADSAERKDASSAVAA